MMAIYFHKSPRIKALFSLLQSYTSTDTQSQSERNSPAENRYYYLSTTVVLTLIIDLVKFH